MKNKAIGLDIGATSIKAVALSENSQGIMLTAALTVPTPAKGMLSEFPLDQEQMAGAIKNVVTETKAGTNIVNVAIPENKVYTKILDMPILSDKELDSAIFWEAEQHIPVPLDTVMLDWSVLRRPDPKNTTKEQMQVLLVGAPTSLIQKYQSIFSMSGLSIGAIETEILSVIRALTYSPDKNAKPFPNTLIVNIGAMSSSIAIIKDNSLVFTYSIAVGGSAINRAIAADFGFSMNQAEEYKKVYGMSEKELGGKIGMATKPILLSIVNEVKKAALFYKSKYQDGSPIAQILLCGGTAKLPGIDLFFAQNCEIESAIANPWHMIKSQAVPKEIVENATDYTIAVGLALRDDE